ncbi:MAG TPA: sensor histidine kinase [Actinomycetaceae bacterium]|nr:sensor histidine kinase [Actinomycetaceae bacterium]
MDSPDVSRPTRGDLVLPVILAVALCVWTWIVLWPIGSGTSPDSPADFAIIAASLMQSLLLIWRRSHPSATALAVFAIGTFHFALGVDLLPSDIAAIVAIYSLAAYGHVLVSRIGLGVMIFVAVGYTALNLGVEEVRSSEMAVNSIVLISVGVAAWALGSSTRVRAEQVTALKSRADQLEIGRDRQAQLAASNERTRIAREMHDTIAHSLSVIIAQADGGRYAAVSDPEAGERALETIAEVGRASLADVRRLLGVLREPSESASLTLPQPGDSDLEELIAGVREAGLRVSVVRIGRERALPPGAGLSVYRIVQEALTNVMKHAGPNAQVTVLIRWLRTGLALEITDDGRGAAASSDGKGQGLVGIRERAAVFGGTVSMGPRSGGGYEVKVLIPLPAARESHVPSQETPSATSVAQAFESPPSTAPTTPIGEPP